MKYDGYQVGIVIKSLRIQRNLTKEALATELGISESTIKKYENGERALSITNLFKIIDYFKVDANTILNVADSKKETSIDSRLELISVIEDMAKNIGITSQHKIDEYISSGNWKKNAGGKGLIPDDSRMDIITKEPNFECIVQNPKVNWEKWFSTLGEYFLEKIEDDFFKGELKFKGSVVKFEVRYSENTIRFKAFGTTNKIILNSLLTKAFTKTAYCELCGVCEVECPTGALTVRDTVEIDKGRCVHCKR